MEEEKVKAINQKVWKTPCPVTCAGCVQCICVLVCMEAGACSVQLRAGAKNIKFSPCVVDDKKNEWNRCMRRDSYVELCRF